MRLIKLLTRDEEKVVFVNPEQVRCLRSDETGDGHEYTVVYFSETHRIDASGELQAVADTLVQGNEREPIELHIVDEAAQR
jgi:hypothetical protein